jgi:hypothetical protein
MAAQRPPAGLAARGRRLWRDLHEIASFDTAQRVLVEEACRMADRLDRLDAILRGEERELVTVVSDLNGEPVRLAVDAVLSEARQQQNMLKQLLVALRLRDEAGKRPQHRGARGAYAGAGAGSVSSLERACRGGAPAAGCRRGHCVDRRRRPDRAHPADRVAQHARRL